MKIYLVFENAYDYVNTSQRLLKVFAEQTAAQVFCDQLNADNKSPREEDSYGPYQGRDFTVEEHLVY